MGQRQFNVEQRTAFKQSSGFRAEDIHRGRHFLAKAFCKLVFESPQKWQAVAHHLNSCGLHERLSGAAASSPVYLFQLILWNSKHKGFAMLYFTCLLMAGEKCFYSCCQDSSVPKVWQLLLDLRVLRFNPHQSFPSLYYVCCGASYGCYLCNEY